MSMSNTKKYVKDIRPNMPWEKAAVNKEWHGMEYKKDYPSFFYPLTFNIWRAVIV